MFMSLLSISILLLLITSILLAAFPGRYINNIGAVGENAPDQFDLDINRPHPDSTLHHRLIK